MSNNTRIGKMDHFAGLALHAMLSGTSEVSGSSGINSSAKIIAARAYEVAAECINERDQLMAAGETGEDEAWHGQLWLKGHDVVFHPTANEDLMVAKGWRKINAAEVTPQ